MCGFCASILSHFIFRLLGDSLPLWTKGVVVQHSSFTETFKIFRFDFVPRYVSHTQFYIPILLVVWLYSFIQSPGNLDGFLVDFEVAPAQFLEGSVGILSVHHDNVGTSSGRYHLRGVWGKRFTWQVTNSEQHTKAQLQEAGRSGGAPRGATEVWEEMLV